MLEIGLMVAREPADELDIPCPDCIDDRLVAFGRRQIIEARFGERDARVNFRVERIPELEKKIVARRSNDGAMEGDAMGDESLGIACPGGGAHAVDMMLNFRRILRKQGCRHASGGFFKGAADQVDILLRSRLELLNERTAARTAGDWRPLWTWDAPRNAPWPIFVRIYQQGEPGVSNGEFTEVLAWEPGREPSPSGPPVRVILSAVRQQFY